MQDCAPTHGNTCITCMTCARGQFPSGEDVFGQKEANLQLETMPVDKVKQVVKKFTEICCLWCFVMFMIILKGKFPQTTMWIEWVEGNFTNPAVKVWADLDNPLKRSDYAKLCMSPSLDVTLPEYVISQEDNSPLTLYIDFHNISFFLDINSPFDQVHL